jgi:ATP-dependent HslUV protease subunit HslV
MLLVASRDELLVLTGDGDVIEPDDGVAAIGSGGVYAQAAARALVRHTDMTAEQIARSAMDIAAGMCIYTNDHILLFSLDGKAPANENGSDTTSATAGDSASADGATDSKRRQKSASQ